MLSGISLALGLRTRMEHPYVYIPCSTCTILSYITIWSIYHIGILMFMWSFWAPVQVGSHSPLGPTWRPPAWSPGVMVEPKGCTGEPMTRQGELRRHSKRDLARKRGWILFEITSSPPPGNCLQSTCGGGGCGGFEGRVAEATLRGVSGTASQTCRTDARQSRAT